MYDTDGDFGQVRLVDSIFPPGMSDAAICFTSAGWHRCNSRYRIDRPDGMGRYLLLFTTGGEGRLRVDGQTRPLPPETAAIVPPWHDTAYYTPEGGLWEFYWLHPEGGAAERLLGYALSLLPEGGPLVVPVQARPYAQGIEQLLRLRDAEDGARETQAAASAQTAALLYRLLEDLAGAGGRGRVSGPVIRHMQAHYAEPLRLCELAAQVYLSPSQLIRQFKRETGYTPHEYLNRLRIARAGRLLRYTDLSVGEVAREVGLRQTSRFIQLYKQMNGVTPGRERRG